MEHSLLSEALTCLSDTRAVTGRECLVQRKEMEELNPQNFPAFVLPPAPALLLGRSLFSLDVYGLILPKQAGNGVYQLKAIYFEIQLPDFPSFVYF